MFLPRSSVRLSVSVGRHIVFAWVVCPSVCQCWETYCFCLGRLSVYLSVLGDILFLPGSSVRLSVSVGRHIVLPGSSVHLSVRLST